MHNTTGPPYTWMTQRYSEVRPPAPPPLPPFKESILHDPKK